MKSILEELFYGNIRPDSRMYRQDSPFVQAARVKHDSMEKMMAAMGDSEKELFEKYCEAQEEMQKNQDLLNKCDLRIKRTDTIKRYPFFMFLQKFL